MCKRFLKCFMLVVLVLFAAAGCGRTPPLSDAAVQDSARSLPTAAVAAVGAGPAAVMGLGRVSVRNRSTSPVWQVEIAERPDEISRGLMFRRSLASDHGMIFVMPRDHDWSFYMRNTYIPLDMVFIDRHWRVVGIAANTRPLTETHHQPGVPCRYVLELGAHQARKNGIVAGTRLAFERLSPASAGAAP